MKQRLRNGLMLFGVLVGALSLLSPLSSLTTHPVQASSLAALPAGNWEGYFERSLTVSNSVSGITVTASTVVHGDIFIQNSGGNLTGSIAPMNYQMNYEVTGPSPVTGYCKGRLDLDITGGSLSEGAGGLPVFDLNLQVANSTIDCNPPDLAGEIIDPSGTVTLRSLTYSGGKATGERADFSTDWIDSAVANLIKAGASVSISEYWELNNFAPVVTGIDPQYRQYFLQDIPVENVYEANVDWRGTEPGKVVFSLNGSEQEGVLSGGTARANINLMGLPVGATPLNVTAYNADNNPSDPMTYPVEIVGMEPWAQKLGFQASRQGDHILYRGVKSVPNEPIKAYVQIPDLIPFIGGQWGLLPTQLNANVSVNSLGGEQSDKIHGQGGFAIGKDVHTLEVNGETYSILTADRLDFDEDKSVIELGTQSFVSSKHYGLLSLIPGASNLFTLPVFGPMLRSVNSVTGITGTISADVSSDLHVGPKQDLSDLTLTRGTVDSNVKVSMDVPLNLGLVNLGVKGGGDGHLKMDVVPKPKVLDCWVNLMFEAHAGVAKFFGVKPAHFSKEWEVASCNSVGLVPAYHFLGAPIASQPASVDLFPRSEEWQPQVFSQTTQQQSGMTETILVENAGMVAQPDLAIRSTGEKAFVWIMEDENKPRQQALEVMVRIQAGEVWAKPAQITEDAYLDFNPLAAFDKKGNLVVVWNSNRMVNEGDEVSFDQSFADHLEIVYALINPQTLEVIETAALTNNEDLDYAPRLVSGRDGTIMLVWQNSLHSSLAGSPEEPNALLAAVWDGAKWSETFEVSNDLQGTLFFQLAVHDSRTAMIVYDQDMDGDLDTSEDREIMFSEWNGKRWEKPSRLTRNDQLDMAPQAAYHENGKPIIAWVSQDQVVGLENNLKQTPQVWVARQMGANFSQARLVVTPDQTVFLLWPEGAADGSEIWMSSHLSGEETWRTPQPLFETATQKDYLSAHSTDTGEISMGLAQFPVEIMQQEMSTGSMVQIPQAAEFGQLTVVDFVPEMSAPVDHAIAEETKENNGSVSWGWVIGGLCLTIVILVGIAVGIVLVLRAKKKNENPLSEGGQVQQ